MSKPCAASFFLFRSLLIHGVEPGLAALHVEDQTFPKRCGHLDDKSLIATADMLHKIKVMKDAQRDPDFVPIARTDAIATEGFAAAIDRSHAYLEAGADVIFVEAPETVEQIEEIARSIPQPKLLELGYKFIIIPSDLQRASIKASQRVLSAIRADGDSSALVDDMVPFAERERIVATTTYLSL